MLTYDFENVEGPLYNYVYRCIKKDIISGVLAPGEKLPSKRSFARNNGISTITIQNAYDQLISEGYVYTIPKTGYYVADIEGMAAVSAKADVSYDIRIPENDGDYIYDLSDNGMNPVNFPFSVWARVSRDVIANRERELMQIAPAGGVKLLREAIAEHLQSFRGMLVDPDQIVIGAGTEYLYGVLIQLLGKRSHIRDRESGLQQARAYLWKTRHYLPFCGDRWMRSDSTGPQGFGSRCSAYIPESPFSDRDHDAGEQEIRGAVMGERERGQIYHRRRLRQ